MSTAPEITDVLTLLHNVPIFRDVESRHWSEIADLAERRTHRAGDLIIKQNDPSVGFGIVEQGAVDIVHYEPDIGIERILDKRERGQTFGLTGLLLEQPRFANIRAREDCIALHFSTQVFQEILERFPRVGLAVSRELASRLADANKSLGIQLERLQNYQPTRDSIHLLPLRMILRQKVLPLLREDNTITMGIVDPTDSVSRNMVAEHLSQYRINWVCISQPDFEEFRDTQLWNLMEQVAEKLGEEEEEELISYQGAAEGMEADSEAADIFDELIRTAILAGASDIHLEPSLKSVRVRTRIDGRLVKLQGDLEIGLYPSLVSRIKVLSNLDIAVRRLPQDGGLNLRFRNRNIDLRISTLPTPTGESIVIRLLDQEKRQLDFDTIFFSEQVQGLVRRMFMQPAGLVLVTGPTGAGKTSTLYAGIRMRLKETPTIKMLTAEDPIEYHLAEATQVQVNPAVGLTFARILRSLLRQDPDVMLVGEIRDADSMEIALEAALTGHLVLASLHTGSALETIQRLRQRGAEKYLIASAVQGVVSQLLVPRLCSACSVESYLLPETVAALEESGIMGLDTHTPIRQAKGCDHCRLSGRRGRAALIEALMMTDKMREVIERGGSQVEMAKALSPSAFVSIRDYAALLIRQGMVDPADILVQFPAKADLIQPE